MVFQSVMHMSVFNLYNLKTPPYTVPTDAHVAIIFIGQWLAELSQFAYDLVKYSILGCSK